MTRAAVPPVCAPPADEIDALLALLELGAPHRVGDLWLVPVFADHTGPDATLLCEGVRARETEITEVSNEGRIDRVRVRHRGDRSLLLLAGEEILGAKQNRVFNASFLVAPGGSAELPVSCVERGRWSYRPSGHAFRSAGRTVSSDMRSGLLRRTSQSVVTRLAYDADQQQVWRDVETHLEHTQVVSVTGAYADAAAIQREAVERHVVTIRPFEQQIGIAAVRGDRVLGLDVLSSESLYARAWPQLARGLLAELRLDRVAAGNPVAVTRAALTAVAEGRRVRRPAPSSGETVHASVRGLALAALVAGGHSYHIAIA